MDHLFTENDITADFPCPHRFKRKFWNWHSTFLFSSSGWNLITGWPQKSVGRSRLMYGYLSSALVASVLKTTYKTLHPKIPRCCWQLPLSHCSPYYNHSWLVHEIYFKGEYLSGAHIIVFISKLIRNSNEKHCNSITRNETPWTSYSHGRILLWKLLCDDASHSVLDRVCTWSTAEFTMYYSRNSQS